MQGWDAGLRRSLSIEGYERKSSGFAGPACSRMHIKGFLLIFLALFHLLTGIAYIEMHQSQGAGQESFNDPGGLSSFR